LLSLILKNREILRLQGRGGYVTRNGGERERVVVVVGFDYLIREIAFFF
jgi:hypothetical protein